MRYQTGNTNGENFELFAAVAAAEGSGIPIAFLLIKTSKEAASGAKEAVLTRFLMELKKKGVNPEFTLSDKDWSEINAMRRVWPHAKHQLCFWHALRALKQRLSKTKHTPAPYNVEEAQREFSYIDTDFVPVAQQPEGITVSLYHMKVMQRNLHYHIGCPATRQTSSSYMANNPRTALCHYTCNSEALLAQTF